MGLREWYSYSVFGMPHGPLGWIGARLMASMKGKYYREMVTESDDEPEELPDGEAVIEDDVVNTPAGPAVRVRCPRCGQWVKPDRARPA